MRVGFVLGPVWAGKYSTARRNAGILPILQLPFKYGLGGYIGRGDQMFPWIHMEDAVGLFLKVIDDETIYGIQNVVSPQKITNQKLMDEFATRIGGKIRWRIPAWIVKRWLKWQGHILLEGEAVPSPEIPYTFKFPMIHQALDDLVKIPKVDTKKETDTKSETPTLNTTETPPKGN
jgi:NAD dependent epimerase/dehydratase family enzyme